MNKHFRIPGPVRPQTGRTRHSRRAVLRRAGLVPNLFDQARVLVSTEELFAFWRALGEVVPDPAIALKLGTETRTERFHPSGLAALSTENFGAAIAHLARYKQLTCPEEIVHAREGEEWPLRFRYLLAIADEPPALIEYAFAWLQSIARHGTGTKIAPLRIELAAPRSHARLIERHFECPVHTGATRNAIVYRAADAQAPFTTRNSELLDMLAPQLEEQLKRATKPDSITDRVRTAIQDRLTGHRPTIDDVSRDLHVSARTLQRQLRDAGATYQQLLDEARHRMARYYLGNSVLELNEAAYLLGYEDSNSFVRAFRAWEGVPPGAWREAHRTSLAIN